MRKPQSRELTSNLKNRLVNHPVLRPFGESSDFERFQRSRPHGCYTLKRTCGYPRSDIARAIEQLLFARQLRVEDREHVLGAVRVYRHSGIRFSDALIAGINRAAGCEATATFDRKAAKATAFRRGEVSCDGFSRSAHRTFAVDIRTVSVYMMGERSCHGCRAGGTSRTNKAQQFSLLRGKKQGSRKKSGMMSSEGGLHRHCGLFDRLRMRGNCELHKRIWR